MKLTVAVSLYNYSIDCFAPKLTGDVAPKDTFALMRVKKSTLFAFFLGVFVLQYSIYLVYSAFWDRVIKLESAAFILLLFKQQRMSNSNRTTIFIYSVLYLIALLASFINFDPDGMLQWTKISLAFLPIPLMSTYVRPGERPPNSLLLWPLWPALFFSLQSVGLSAIIHWDIPIERGFVAIERQGGMIYPSYGIWGFGAVLHADRYGEYVLRAMSWFIEPSKLAGFLIYPSLVASAVAFSRRSFLFLFVAISCLLALGLTFSLAGYFGFATAILSLLLVRPTRVRSAVHATLRYVRPAVLGAAALFVALQFLSFTHALYSTGLNYDSVLVSVLARDPHTQTLVREASRVPETIDLLRQHPFGVGMGFTAVADAASPNAFVYWTIAGGIPAIFVVLFLYFHLMTRYCIPLLESDDIVFRTVAAAFIGHTVQQLSYGTWAEPAYFVCVGAMMLCGGFVETTTKSPKAQDRPLYATT